MSFENIFSVNAKCQFCGQEYPFSNIVHGELMPERILAMKCPHCHIEITYPEIVGKALAIILATTMNTVQLTNIDQAEVDDTDFDQLALDLQGNHD